jgi:hypothetical protein
MADGGAQHHEAPVQRTLYYSRLLVTRYCFEHHPMNPTDPALQNTSAITTLYGCAGYVW